MRACFPWWSGESLPFLSSCISSLVGICLCHSFQDGRLNCIHLIFGPLCIGWEGGVKLMLSYLLSRVRLFATLWTVAHQDPTSMGFSRQEYWNGLPFPSPEDLPDPGIKPRSPTLEADSLTSEPPGKPCKHGRISQRKRRR